MKIANLHRCLGLCAVIVAATCAAARAQTLTTLRIASGLNRPDFVTAAPGDPTRLFYLEKRGVIRIIDLTTNTVLATPFLDIDSLVVDLSTQFPDSDERGLLGLAFHPDYANNGFFYVNYIDLNSDSIIARYTRTAGNPNTANPATRLQILFVDQPFSNHNGGWLGFGPNDGFLYCAFGDGGSACDPGQRAQDITTQLLGKMLRIDINTDGFPADPARFYSIPANNPFVGITGDDEIWAYGLRNPWRDSFDRANGNLYIGDVGQNNWEEIDVQLAASAGGENYGWDCLEGNHCALESSQCNGTTVGCCATLCSCSPQTPNMIAPMHEFAHVVTGTDNCSVTGGYVYRGPAMPALQGTYFFADYCSARIFSFRFTGTGITELQDRTTQLDPCGTLTISSIVSFGEDAAGEVYIVQAGTGTAGGAIYKIIENPGCTYMITQQPSPQTRCIGETATFTVVANNCNIGIPTYQWQRNSVNFGTVSTNPTLTINNVQAAQGGTFRVIITTQCATLTSNGALLTVNGPTTIQQQPVDQSVCVGQAANFSVSATGVGTLLYQWRRNGTPLADGGNISGATTANLMINPVAGGDAGEYDVVIDSTCADLISESATLAIITTLAGDIDNDCDRDAVDLDLFIRVLLGLETDPGRVMRSDINTSGQADGEDIEPFSALFIGP